MSRSSCQHQHLLLETSVHELSNQFREVFKRRQTSEKTLESHKNRIPVAPDAFPSPLVLPGDELSWEPNYAPQSVLSWVREPHRNPITAGRRTIYIAAAEKADFMSGWSRPVIPTGKLKDREGSFSADLQDSDVEAVIEYLQAFYHGITVKRFDVRLQFTTWSESMKSPRRKGQLVAANEAVGLNTDSECIRIRTRASLDGLFAHQANLSDLLDVCISVVPDDAYALLLLTNLDLYEDDEDDFCCGRAYGGSRVAVVSTSRYNPLLDKIQGIDRLHSWPASHCTRYVDKVIREAGYSSVKSSRQKKRKHSEDSTLASHGNSPSTAGDGSPLEAAVQATLSLPAISKTNALDALRSLWISRVCRTASHELGHCFGIDHCVHHACNMQGTASIKEDARQPPYLCPVDLEKVLKATGVDERERYEAVVEYCEQWNGTPGADMFVAYAAWIRMILESSRSEREASL